jgi:hypothetical protein
MRLTDGEREILAEQERDARDIEEGRFPSAAELTRLALIDAARLVARVRLTPEEGPGPYRLVPSLAEGDLCRIVPRLADRLADLIAAGRVPDEAGESCRTLRGIARGVEASGFPHRKPVGAS